jgi:hypothetical protein
MQPQNRIWELAVTALVERVYFLIPGAVAIALFWSAAVLGRIGVRSPFVGRIVLSLLFANVGAAIFILVFGAPGIFKRWRRWATGLLATAAMVVVAGWIVL